MPQVGGGGTVVDRTFDMTQGLRTNSASRLDNALIGMDDGDTVHVVVSSSDTDRLGPILTTLSNRGYEYHTKGDPAGGLTVTARQHEGD